MQGRALSSKDRVPSSPLQKLRALLPAIGVLGAPLSLVRERMSTLVLSFACFERHVREVTSLRDLLPHRHALE